MGERQKGTMEVLGIAGSGKIASGLAAVASVVGEVTLWARSDASAQRAQSGIERFCGKLEGAESDRVLVTTEPEKLAGATLVVESIIEREEPKRELLTRLGDLLPDETILATTTSSLSVPRLAEASGRPERFFALHVFNPVQRMKLVELCFPEKAVDEVRKRAHDFCEGLGKTPVEVPREPGFVVNRLLFPYLFDAVRLMELTGMKPENLDICMRLGAGHPMGPLALLDYVGLDVADSIGEALYADSNESRHKPPGRLKALVREGKLGKKAGAGFYKYGEPGPRS